MNQAQLLQEFSALSPEAQKLVADLVRFLNQSSSSADFIEHNKQSAIPLRDEPFFGMWRDREDMTDSVEWVRNLRRSQWGRNTE